MTYSRSLLLATCAALAVTACSPRPQAADSTQVVPAARDPFVSDRISVTTRGPQQAPDIVLVHGLGAHRDTWGTVADSLAARYRLHLVQINGFAGAAPGANAGGPVLGPTAEEIARYISSLGRGPAAIVGHSMGGLIGMMVAARHPQAVGQLVVIDEPPSLGAVFGVEWTPDSLRRFADRQRDAILAAPPGTVGPFEQMIPSMTRVDTARPVLLQYARASHRPTVANAFHELMVTDLRPELGRISAPVTVLYVLPASVPMSPDVFRGNWQRAFAAVQRLRLVRVDSSEHYIQIDQPRRVVEEVRALIGEPR